jgi:PAS domain S-box-containing protein
MLQSSYNPVLVVLSVLVSVFAGFTALNLAERIRESDGSARAIWLFTAAVAMGGGIWSMHFIAMLAYDIGVPVSYETGLTALSLLLAIGFTAAGLYAVATFGHRPAIIASAGVFMGLGIASMHYTGMAAMHMAAVIIYDPLIVAASVAIAVAASGTALWLSFNLSTFAARFGAAFAMGAAVSGMHYTGMAAVTCEPMQNGEIEPAQISTHLLALGIMASTVVVLVVALASAVIDRRVGHRLRREAELLRNSEQRFRLIVDGARDYAIFTLDPDGNVTSWNAGAERIFGYSQDEALGRHMAAFYTPAIGSTDLPRRALEIADESGSYSVEGIRLRKNGERFWSLAALHKLVNPDGSHGGFATIIRDISERKDAETALQRAHDDLEAKVEQRAKEYLEAKQAAEAANEAKSQFVTNMSHELRTPLSAIIGYSEMLLEDMEEAGNTSAMSDLQRIARSGQHLLRLINEILDVAKMEAGHVEFDFQDIALGPLLNEISDTVIPLAAAGSNKYSLVSETSVSMIRTDAQKLKQCLINLLGNACKFTAEGRVELHVRESTINGQDALAFAVIDSGVGMSEMQLARVFEAFFQADVTSNRKRGGTGLGLTITKKLAELLGGHITAWSEPGMGSTFEIVLPVSRPLAGDASAPSADRAQRTQIPTTDPRVRDPDFDRSKLVLLIDDDPNILDLLGRHLERQGFHPAYAANARDGLALAEQIRPAIILLDVMLPDEIGWTVLQRIKQSPTLTGTPVVMMSILDDQKRAQELGAAHYLLKPIDTTILFDILTRHAENRAGASVVLSSTDASFLACVTGRLMEIGYRVHHLESNRDAPSDPSAVIVDVGDQQEAETDRLARVYARFPATPLILAVDGSARDNTLLLGGDVTAVLNKNCLPLGESLAAVIERSVFQPVAATVSASTE